MKVKDVIDRLQPGMLYQRIHMAGYDRKSDPVTVTGKVMGHDTDIDGKKWIAVNEFYLGKYNAVNYPNTSFGSILSMDTEFALLAYSEDSISTDLGEAALRLENKTREARAAYERLKADYEVLAVIEEDFARDRAFAAHRVEEIGRGTLTAREDYDQRVLDAVNQIDLDAELDFQQDATEES